MKNKNNSLKYLLILFVIILFVGTIFLLSAKKETNQQLKNNKTEQIVPIGSLEEGAILENQAEVIEETSNIAKEDIEKTKEETVSEEDSVIEESEDAFEETVSDESENRAENLPAEDSDNSPEVIEESYMPIKTTEGITLLGVQSYSGKYFEDGSDEIVNDVMALYIKNTGKKEIQLANFKVYDKNRNAYDFVLTTLLPNQEMIVLENSRTKYDENITLVSAQVTSLAVFSETPSLHKEIFKIDSKDNLITVTNISEEKILAARICYKNCIDNVYIGGITYTMSIPELSPGESIELSTRHYIESASQIVFVNYAK